MVRAPKLIHIQFLNIILQMLRLLIVFTPLFWLLALIACSGGDDRLLVSAAASMRDALEAIADSFETDTGILVAYNFGGSRALARQIELGAPADVVVFAGESPMNHLDERGLIRRESRREIAENRLVLIAIEDLPNSLYGLGGLEIDASERMAIADPALAPAGEYARTALKAAGLWEKIQDNLVFAIDVRAAVTAVTSGNVKYAIVYESDVVVLPKTRSVFLIAESLYPPVIYPAAVVQNSVNSEIAEAFVRYLGDVETGKTMIEHGFKVEKR